MRNFLFIGFISLIGCSTRTVKVTDVREQYEGTYTGTTESAIAFSLQPSVLKTYSEAITLKKGKEPNTMVMEANTLTLETILNLSADGSFSGDYERLIKLGQVEQLTKLKIVGKFTDNRLTYSITSLEMARSNPRQPYIQLQEQFEGTKK